jgi:hypothetical protein
MWVILRAQALDCITGDWHRIPYQSSVLLREDGSPGRRSFATALFDLLHGDEPIDVRFSSWVAAISSLPRRQTRVLTWPLVTVFGFIAQPATHFFFKPMVTREAARRYGVDLPYASRPSWPVYRDLLAVVRKERSDIRDLKPRDMIDLQSFLWVQGSDEYPD